MEEHRDDEASKLGMWLFLFTEMLLFAGLFIVYSVYRYKNPEAFHQAAQELDVTIGTINTILLLISSMTIAMSITALQKKMKKLAIGLLSVTLTLGFVFLVKTFPVGIPANETTMTVVLVYCCVACGNDVC